MKDLKYIDMIRFFALLRMTEWSLIGLFTSPSIINYHKILRNSIKEGGGSKKRGIPTCGRHEGIPRHAELNVLIGGEKFTVVVEGNPLFFLHKAFNIGRTIIIGCQS